MTFSSMLLKKQIQVLFGIIPSSTFSTAAFLHFPPNGSRYGLKHLWKETYRDVSNKGSTTSRTDRLFSTTSPSDNETVWKTDVPLVFIPGLKGTHLSFIDESEESILSSDFRNKVDTLLDELQIPSRKEPKKKRAWLTLSALLNFPPRPDDDSGRSLALPITYTNGTQDSGKLFQDGIVEHIIELGGVGKTLESDVNGKSKNLEFFPFYGHVTKHLQEVDERYNNSTENAFMDENMFREMNASAVLHCRPTAVFPYDWRRSLSELSTEFHEFCETTFPSQPVQVVAHSMGGIISYAAMQRHPEKYRPGGVLVGVPFGTGIQYLEDMHKGYYTELNRCRQFTPRDQFTFSSHWIFFPTKQEDIGNSFIDVTNRNVTFDADKSKIGKVNANENITSIAVEGEEIKIDFFDVADWEKHELGIFSPRWRNMLGEDTIHQYKNHLRIQLKETKEFRETYLSEETAKNLGKINLPPLVFASTNTVPTLNQILRREKSTDVNNELDADSWEYDYSNGRCVKGDGRIDYDKSFPIGVEVKKVQLDSIHAKQMCWENSGGSWGVIWGEVCNQVQSYIERLENEEDSMDIDHQLAKADLVLRKEPRLRPKRFVMRIKTWREKRRVKGRIVKRRVKLLSKMRIKRPKRRTRLAAGSRRQ